MWKSATRHLLRSPRLESPGSVSLENGKFSVTVRFPVVLELPKELNLLPEIIRRMEPVHRGGQPPCRFKVSCGCKFAHALERNRGQKEKRYPGAAANVARFAAKKQPGGTGYSENDNRRDPPATISCVGTPV